MCDTDLTLAESRKSCRNARVTLVLDLRDVFFETNTPWKSCDVQGDFFELWVGIGACNREMSCGQMVRKVRGEQRCKSGGHVRKLKRTSGSPGRISVVL